MLAGIAGIGGMIIQTMPYPPASGVTFVGSKNFSNGTPAAGVHTISLADLKNEGGDDVVLQESDFLVINYGIYANSDLALNQPSGWEEAAELYRNDNQDTNQAVWYKHMSSSPDTSVDVPTFTDNGISGQVFAFRGINTSTPLDVARTTAAGGGSVIVNPAAITPVTTGAIVVCCGAGAKSNTNAETYAHGGDLSSGTNHFRSTSVGPTGRSLTGMGFYSGWTSGAFNPAAWDPTGAETGFDWSWAAVTLALRPA